MKGDIFIRGNPARDARLDKIAEHFGLPSMNAFLGVIAHQMARIPHPRYVFRVIGAMEAEIEAIREEEKQRKGGQKGE